MRHLFPLLIGGLLIVFLGLVSFGYKQTAGCPDFHQAGLKINNQRWSIGIADTPQAKAYGLSGCVHIPERAGLLFPFVPSSPVTFWMKDMVVPIDMIWIKQGKIIGIEKNVPTQPGVAEQDLTRHSPGQDIDAVLEIAAGGSNRAGLEVGMAVTLPVGIDKK